MSVEDHETGPGVTPAAAPAPPAATEPWLRHVGRAENSLPEVHGSVPIPITASFWRKMFAFAGPGYLVAVGYMDPGNWATDIAGGARYGYTLLSVIMISNLMAILLQALAARLGIASGRDLAQACRDSYSRPVTLVLWVLAEIAIAATDLAEVIGAAIALNLLFGLPLLAGVLITAFDVLIVLYLQQHRFRYVEGPRAAADPRHRGRFAIELVLSSPPLAAVLRGFIPTTEIVRDPDMLYIAIGILGATVMPHNLYLHSSIVQTRKYGDDLESRRSAVTFATIDSTVALSSALFINAAILIVAAATFHGTGYEHIADIGDAYQMLDAAARHADGLDAVRACAALRRPERDHHGHAGRADRDGRLPVAAPAPVVAPAGHAADRDHPGGRGHRHLRRAGHQARC